MRCATGGGTNSDLCKDVAENDAAGRFGSMPLTWFDCMLGSTACGTLPVIAGHREHELFCPQMPPVAASDGCGEVEYAMEGMLNIDGINADMSGMAGTLAGGPSWAASRPATGWCAGWTFICGETMAFG